MRKGTYIRSVNGIVPVEEFVNLNEKGSKFSRKITEQYDGGLKKTSKVWYQGKKHGFTFNLSYGLKLEVTDEHPVHVRTENGLVFKRADELKVGDELGLKIGSDFVKSKGDIDDSMDRYWASKFLGKELWEDVKEWTNKFLSKEEFSNVVTWGLNSS